MKRRTIKQKPRDPEAGASGSPPALPAVLGWMPWGLAGRTVLFFCAALAWSGSVMAAEDVSAFVDRIVTAYGGAASLSQGGVVRQSGHTVSMMRGGATGDLVRLFQPPDKLRVEIVYPDEEPEVRVLDGERGWNKGVEVTAPMHGAMRLQAARMALPLILLDEKAKVMDKGMAKGPNDEDLRVLELPLGRHLVLFVGADPASGRILVSRGQLYLGDGTAMEFATTYSRFETRNGRLFAAKEEQFAMGVYTGFNLIENVEFVDVVGPETFQP